MNPDLTIEHVRTCKANVFWQKQVPSSDGSKTYTVVFGPTSGGEYAYDWFCDCPARVECKHIKACKEEKCEWNWEAFMGHQAEPNPDKTCPECGGETTVIKVGV